MTCTTPWTLRTLLAVGTIVGLASVAWPDIIELTDGRKISGSVSRQGDAMLIKGDDGKILSVAPADISRVTLTSSVTPAEAAAADWTRLTLDIKKADDLASILALHQKFLQQYPDVPLARQVRDSLAVYQQLADAGAVKFRGRWMPRAQIDVTLKQWTEDAKPALTLYHAGRLKEAVDAAKVALVKDEQNPDALSIAGLAYYRLNNLQQARTYFANLAGADPSDVLAENNLGVVSYQQKLPGEGILHYIKALQIAPDNRLVLDNIAEAINAYAGDKNSTNFRALTRQYEQAETRAEAEMGKKGLQRWGSTWVTKDQLDRLQKYRRAVQDEMAQLDGQYRSVQDALANLDVQIKRAAADYDTYVANVNFDNSQILLLQQRPLDAAVYVAQRDIAAQNADRTARQQSALEAQRTQLIAGSHDLFAEADKLKAMLASAQSSYTGMQRIMELGEAETPPPPVAVADPPQVPALPQLPPMVIAPVPQAPPPMVIPVPVPVFVTPIQSH